MHHNVKIVEFSAEKGDGRDEVLEIIGKYIEDYTVRMEILNKIDEEILEIEQDDNLEQE